MSERPGGRTLSTGLEDVQLMGQVRHFAFSTLVHRSLQRQSGSRSESNFSMQKQSATSLPTLSVRIDLDSEGRIGPGKIELLENIREFGSISGAGRAMDMSYKRAWDLVDEINRICGHPVVEPQAGGKNGGGAMLTPFGTKLVARYRKI